MLWERSGKTGEGCSSKSAQRTALLQEEASVAKKTHAMPAVARRCNATGATELQAESNSPGMVAGMLYDVVSHMPCEEFAVLPEVSVA